MKKIILTSMMMIVLGITASFSQETVTGGARRGGTGNEMRQRIKDRLKTELNITDEQVTSITTIQQEYQLKARSVKMDTKTSADEKAALIKPIEDDRRQKLKAILSDEQITRLDAMTEKMKKMVAQRQGS